MNQIFFSIRLRRYTTLGFFFCMVFFAYLMGASANDRCPAKEAHELSKIRYQMFTAYQTAYDGYQTPCELKCFEKTTCSHRCRQNKALESLQQHFNREMQSRGIASCESLQQVCLEQCQGEGCQQACQQ